MPFKNPFRTVHPLNLLSKLFKDGTRKETVASEIETPVSTVKQSDTQKKDDQKINNKAKERNPQGISNEQSRQIMSEAALENIPDEQKPDVFLDVPVLNIQEIKLNVDNLDARVALRAELANLIKIDIGAQVGIQKVDLDIRGVEAQASLKVRLKQVNAIFSRALEAIEKNPEILSNLLKSAHESTPLEQKVKSTGERTPSISNVNKDAIIDSNQGIEPTADKSAGNPIDSRDVNSLKEINPKSVTRNGTLGSSVNDISIDLNSSIETKSNVSEQERRRMHKIDK